MAPRTPRRLKPGGYDGSPVNLESDSVSLVDVSFIENNIGIESLYSIDLHGNLDYSKPSEEARSREAYTQQQHAYKKPPSNDAYSKYEYEQSADGYYSKHEESVQDGYTIADDSLGAEEEAAPKSIAYWKLFRYANTLDHLLMFIGALAAAAHGFTSPYIVLLFGYMNNAYANADPHKAYREVVKIVLIITYIAIGTTLVSAIEVVCWMQIGERQATHIKTRYLEALLRQEIGFYDTEAKVGDIVNAISSDIILIHDAVGEKVGACICNLSIFVSGVILGILQYWKLGLLGLTATPLLLGTGGVFIAFYTKYTLEALSAYRRADLVAEQAISQVRTVYSFVGEMKALESFKQLLQEAVKLSSKTGLSKGLGLGTLLAVSYLSWALQFWYGSTLVKKHKIKGGTVNSLIFISVLAGKALGECLQVVEFIAKGKASAVRLFDIIERESKIDSSSRQGKVLSKVEGRIELYKVSFCYPARPEAPIFANISLKIPPGKIVALVGSSGSGKSTVISLIERFYDPQKGEVRIDGRDIRTLQLKWLRTQIGLVSQEPTMFATTIKKNILMGKPDAKHEEVISAAKVANAHLFICELPEGYNTEVGDRGIQLSGGQRQRIAIARAILRKPAIMLLDEATSALDSESEHVVQTALDRVMQGRTTVVVAHRLSTIRNADTIVVFEKGRIVESGTHEQLLARQNGAYAALVATQEAGRIPRKKMMSSSSASPMRTRTASDYESRRRPSRFSYDSVSFSSTFNFPSGFPSPSADKLDKLEDPEDVKVAMKLQSSYSVSAWFGGLFRHVWPSAVVGTLGAVISGILAAVFPLVMANILVLLLENHTSKAGKWILAFVGVAVATLLSNLVQYFYYHKVGAKVSQEIQEKSLEGILKNEVGWFDFEENSSAAISSRLSSNTTIVRNVLSDTCCYFLQNVLGIVLALIFAIFYEWRMGLISLAMLPFQVLGSAVTNAYTKDGFSGDVQKFHEKASRVAGEAVSSIRTVLSFGAEENILSKFKDHLVEAKSQRFSRACLVGLFLGVSHGLLYVSNGLCMWYGIVLIKNGSATFAPLIISFSIVAYTAYNCVELLRLVPDFVRGAHAVISMFHVAHRQTEIVPDSPYGIKLDKVLGNIELKNVTFRYPSRPEVLILNNLSLKIKAGSTVALVGASGSGKSSVLALIERFYDPLAGSVHLDGRDLKSLNLRWLRQHLGFVQQEPALFGVSIRENILYGKEGASEAEIVEAAKKANAHTFISSLPEGYDTDVGERGVQLSGGQKQRIAIARAILKNPTILLLDEATSALDVESERIVQEAIDRLVGRDRTTVVVAHRLSTIQSADAIVVMEHGSILEKGRHKKLLEQGGAYAKLMSMQQRNDLT